MGGVLKLDIFTIFFKYIKHEKINKKILKSFIMLYKILVFILCVSECKRSSKF